MVITTLPAAAAIATAIIEVKKRSRMTLPSPSLLLQRIVFDADKIRGDVLCRRVGSLALRKGLLFRARSVHQSRETVISLVAAGLVIDSVLLLALLGELLLHRPWPRPHRRIFDRDRILKRIWSGADPALDKMQVLA